MNGSTGSHDNAGPDQRPVLPALPTKSMLDTWAETKDKSSLSISESLYVASNKGQ